MGDPLFATRGQWRRRASDSDETPPIDLLLLYCVRRPTVFSRFLVCQSHKPKEHNKVNTHTTLISIIRVKYSSCTNQMASPSVLSVCICLNFCGIRICRVNSYQLSYTLLLYLVFYMLYQRGVDFCLPSLRIGSMPF